ncbi:MAG TPA: hypothetical protein VJN18_32860 [Polyangiaceae bacterium]|nr:hypothetical protein [Polyangiaceae bacterium]
MSASGSIESCNIDGRRFSVAADADADRDLGGFTNEAQPNGDGTVRYVKTKKAWKVSGVSLSINNTRGDLEFLQQKANQLDPYPISLTFVDGFTYAGVGMLTGDLASKTMTGTADVEFSGEHTLAAQ